MRNISLSQIDNSVFLGIFFGLFLGKQIGVFLFVFITVKLGLIKLPVGVNWRQFYGVAILTGVGFTMSLFINSLAYEDSNIFFYTDKLAILFGSLVSALMGYFILLKTANKNIS